MSKIKMKDLKAAAKNLNQILGCKPPIDVNDDEESITSGCISAAELFVEKEIEQGFVVDPKTEKELKIEKITYEVLEALEVPGFELEEDNKGSKEETKEKPRDKKVTPKKKETKKKDPPKAKPKETKVKSKTPEKKKAAVPRGEVQRDKYGFVEGSIRSLFAQACAKKPMTFAEARQAKWNPTPRYNFRETFKSMEAKKIAKLDEQGRVVIIKK